MRTMICISFIFTLVAINDTECKQKAIRQQNSGNPEIVYTYNNPDDTTKEYFVTIYPEGAVRGTLILIPGFGELPKTTLIETDIYKYASKSGYLTVIPALGDWTFFYIDSISHQRLNQFINTVFEKYQLPEKHFFIGGFSFGGVAAFQYTCRAYQPDSKLIKPSGVFGIDPPLDLERLYISMTTTDRPPKHPVSQNEDSYIVNLFQEKFKTNPIENQEFFWKISPFSRSDTSHSSLKTLLNVPIRIYNDPDINWFIDNRYVDYTHMNVFDAAGMINWLKSKGNTNAELINCMGKGFRKEKNFRHPHSWSIVDGKELLDWIKKN